MEELPTIRQILNTYLTEYSIVNCHIGALDPAHTDASTRCYYYPKRDKKAIAICGLIVIPKAYQNDEWKPSLIFSVYIYEDYTLYFRGDEELFPILKPFFTNYKETILSKHDNEYKAKKFMNACKRELMEKAWHPRRVSSWLDAGLKLEDI